MKTKLTAEKVTPRITQVENKTFDILNYDFDNKYPQRVNDILNDSGTAKSCLRLFSKFIMGGGAVDKTFYKTKVNDTGLTVDKLIRKMARSLGKFEGFAIHVNYNGLGQKVDAHFIPFEYCRLCPIDSEEHAGKVAIYDDWGATKRKQFKKSELSYINIYNPNNVLKEVEEAGGWDLYKGQIFYYSPEGFEYPLSPFDAVLEDCQTERNIKFFKNSTSSKNFLASHILVTGKNEDDDGGEGFVENLKAFQGGEGSGSLFWFEKENAEDKVELIKVDIQNYDKLFEYTEGSARDAIVRQALIPPVLLMQTPGKLGTSTEIADAFDYYNGVVYDYRLIIEEALTEIFDNWYREINPSKDYSIIPLKYTRKIEEAYFPYYTANEIRLANGDEEANDAKSDTKLLAVTLGVGGTQSLVAIISDVNLSDEQKKGTLKILFGLTDDQVSQMLSTNSNTL